MLQYLLGSMYLVVEPAVEEDRISVLVGHLPVGGDHLVVVVDPLLEVMVPEVYLYLVDLVQGWILVCNYVCRSW